MGMLKQRKPTINSSSESVKRVSCIGDVEGWKAMEFSGCD